MNIADCSGDSVSLSEFPPVEERSGPEGAEEDGPGENMTCLKHFQQKLNLLINRDSPCR